MPCRVAILKGPRRISLETSSIAPGRQKSDAPTAGERAGWKKKVDYPNCATTTPQIAIVPPAMKAGVTVWSRSRTARTVVRIG